MEMKELLEKLTQRTGKSKDELNKELNTTYDKFKNGNAQQPEKFRKTDEEIKQMAIRNFHASYRKELTSRGTQFECTFFSCSAVNREKGVGDMVAKRRREAFEYHHDHPEKALEKGIVKIAPEEVKDGDTVIIRKGEVIPLQYDTQEKFSDMQDWLIKANYEEDEKGILVKNGVKYIGRPLPKTKFQRTVIGKGKKVGEPDSEYRAISVILRDKNVDVFIPTFVPVICSLYIKKASTSSQYVCNDSGAFVPKISGDELVEGQVLEDLTKLYGDNKLELKDFDEKVGARPNDWNFLVWVKATITNIVPTTGDKSQQIEIEDDTMEMFDKEGNPIGPLTCWLADHIKLNAPERSEVYIIGNPKIKETEKATYKNISINGMFVPQIFRNTVSNKEVF